jgi:tRNA(fMet)-specific endonuclease VapC
VSYLLDTNAVIGIINGRPPSVREHFRAARDQGAATAISVVTLFELYYGAARSQHHQQNAERLRVFLSGDIAVLSFEAADAAVAGDLRARLRDLGTPIGPYDLLIAAQGLRAGLIVVTANTAEFARIDGLRLADWSKPLSA